jgi:hypothetical protein
MQERAGKREVHFGPCCFCGEPIEPTPREPARLTVETAEGKWQVWFCHCACFKLRITTRWDLEPAHF